MEAPWPPPPLPEFMWMDGVPYRLPGWMDEGTSFFIPSLDHLRTIGAVRMHYGPFRFRLGWKERIESGVLGIRVWRVP